MKAIGVTLLLTAMMLAGWSACHTTTAGPIEPDGPAMVVVDGGCTTTCECACVALAQHSCPESKPTPNGKPCAEVCQEVRDAKLSGWNAECIAAKPTLAEIRNCGVACAGGN